MKVGVVLGGGGARCFAHIGALQALEEHGFEPVALSTCSAVQSSARFTRPVTRRNVSKRFFTIRICLKF